MLRRLVPNLWAQELKVCPPEHQGIWRQGLRRTYFQESCLQGLEEFGEMINTVLCYLKSIVMMLQVFKDPREDIC